MSVPATFAAGCYWGTEHFFMRHFKEAIIKHQVGFMGGIDKEKVSYSDVKSGTSGHAEVFHFEYDPAKAKYEELLAFFFRIHNSTTLNRQANDTGTQYRSAVFYHTAEQKQLAEEYIAKLNGGDKDLHATYSHAFGGGKCVTVVSPAGTFYPAEEDHQSYLEKNPSGYCSHRIYY